MTTIEGLRHVLGNIYPYLILILLAQLMRATIDSFIQVQCN